MTVRKRGRHWHIDFQIRGVRYRESVPEAATKREALDVEAKMRRAVYEGRYGRQAGNMPFEKFVKETFFKYAEINRKRYEQDKRIAQRFIELFAGRSLGEIPPMLIEQAKKKLSVGRKASTVNSMLAVLHRVFSLAVENQQLRDNPMRHVRRLQEDDKPDRVMFADEEQRLRDVFPTQAMFYVLYIFFELVMQTGMRESETCAISEQEVDFSRRIIRLSANQTKEKRAKIIPLNDIAYNLLLERRDEINKYFVGVTPSHIRHLWRAACVQANVHGLTIHQLRHTVATRLSEAGVPDAVRMALLGHSSLRMTRDYTHPGIESLGDAVRKLSQPRLEVDKKRQSFR